MYFVSDVAKIPTYPLNVTLSPIRETNSPGDPIESNTCICKSLRVHFSVTDAVTGQQTAVPSVFAISQRS